MSRLEIIPELTNLLLEFTVSVLVNKPPDLVEYASEYFTRMLEDRGGGNVKRTSKTSATSNGSNQQSPNKSGNRSSSLESNHMDEEEDEFSKWHLFFQFPHPLFLDPCLSLFGSFFTTFLPASSLHPHPLGNLSREKHLSARLEYERYCFSTN